MKWLIKGIRILTGQELVSTPDLEARIEALEGHCQGLSEIMSEQVKLTREHTTTLDKIDKAYYRWLGKDKDGLAEAEQAFQGADQPQEKLDLNSLPPGTDLASLRR